MVMMTSPSGFSSSRKYKNLSCTLNAQFNLIDLIGRAARGIRVETGAGQTLDLIINGTFHIIKHHEDRCDETIAVTPTTPIGVVMRTDAAELHNFENKSIPIEHLEVTAITGGPLNITVFW